jgi:hypothetical protein
LSDWAAVVALHPDEAAVRSLAQAKIGAFSPDEAFEQRKRLNDAAGYEAIWTTQWVSVHALSPQLYAEFAKVQKADEDGYRSFDMARVILEDFQQPRYAVGQHTVLCTEREAEDLLYVRRVPLYQGDPSEDAAEALADAMGDATHPMHEDHYEAEEEAFTRRYDREQLGQARAAVNLKTPSPE